MNPKRVYGSYTLVGIVVVRVYDPPPPPPILGLISSPRYYCAYKHIRVLTGLKSGLYKCSGNWFISTMNLQVGV